jgi:transposase
MYVGIDAHKRMCHATVLSEGGTVVEETPFPTNVKFLETWARTLPRDSKVAIESSTISKRLARALIGIGLEV